VRALRLNEVVFVKFSTEGDLQFREYLGMGDEAEYQGHMDALYPKNDEGYRRIPLRALFFVFPKTNPSPFVGDLILLSDSV
tara:strand:+ start:284 stop:526 length:243 start_codon:yes stop_codon:yes gene_type:complete